MQSNSSKFDRSSDGDLKYLKLVLRYSFCLLFGFLLIAKAHRCSKRHRLTPEEKEQVVANELTNYFLAFWCVKYVNKFLYDCFVATQKNLAKKAKQNILAKKRTKRTEFRWEVTMIYMHGAQLPVPFLPIRPGKQTEIAKYLCRKYSPHFTNLKMAKVFVHHTLKLYDARPDNDNKDPFRDKRGENRKRTKRDNPRLGFGVGV